MSSVDELFRGRQIRVEEMKLDPKNDLSTDQVTKSQLTKFRVAVYGVLVEDEKILLTETRTPSGVIVNLPGGGLELGEEPLAALEREFQEETALTVRIGELLYCSQLFHQNLYFPTEQLIHMYYRVYKIGGTLLELGNQDDVAGVLWCSLGEIPMERIQAVDREFLEHTRFAALLAERSV